MIPSEETPNDPYRSPSAHRAPTETIVDSQAPPGPRGSWSAILAVGLLGAAICYLLLVALPQTGIVLLAVPYLSLTGVAVGIRLLYPTPPPNPPIVLAHSLAIALLGGFSLFIGHLLVGLCWALVFTFTSASFERTVGAFAIVAGAITWTIPFLIATAGMATVIRLVQLLGWEAAENAQQCGETSDDAPA